MKANFILLHVLIGFIFVVSGLLINGLMLLANIFIWPFNKTLYRKIVNNLAYTHWCREFFKFELLINVESNNAFSI